ncbi:ATP-binding cassette domain-containing protein [Marivivens sp. LCG002]|uniref:ATP-binding cassette domain-containing protein n=1 Tax=Marivivens sp. LCG002 TaxID=3051171 RepID=UPI002553A0FC|nr:ATP-binding cassette domain-containing protein [Marivivens sp. LCG002]WIV50838.1 ATP-binding cassette domain-containing protein [Marivivens sp. LCG002]
MDETLTVRALRISLDNRPLLELDFQVPPSRILTIMGPSGAGKSTLLAWMTGHLSPEFTAEGRISLGDKDLTEVPPHLRNIGILFQDPLLFPHMSVGGNIAFGLRDPSDRDLAVRTALSQVDLEGFETRDPETLSGGQKARVALMRALVAKPQALLLDEPFSKLDNALRDTVRRLVFDRIKERGIPAVLVTHDEGDALAAGGPIITLG